MLSCFQASGARSCIDPFSQWTIRKGFAPESLGVRCERNSVAGDAPIHGKAEIEAGNKLAVSALQELMPRSKIVTLSLAPSRKRKRVKRQHVLKASAIGLWTRSTPGGALINVRVTFQSDRSLQPAVRPGQAWSKPGGAARRATFPKSNRRKVPKPKKVLKRKTSRRRRFRAGEKKGCRSNHRRPKASSFYGSHAVLARALDV